MTPRPRERTSSGLISSSARQDLGARQLGDGPASLGLVEGWDAKGDVAQELDEHDAVVAWGR
jgi:hypothetical protein